VNGTGEQISWAFEIDSLELASTSNPDTLESPMTSITESAKKFFEACEAGKGWEGCKAYCKADATFSAQAEPLAGVNTLQQYTDWMKGLLTFMPDGRYELKSFVATSTAFCTQVRVLPGAKSVVSPQ
jgi:hypothetical protein